MSAQTRRHQRRLAHRHSPEWCPYIQSWWCAGCSYEFDWDPPEMTQAEHEVELELLREAGLIPGADDPPVYHYGLQEAFDRAVAEALAAAARPAAWGEVSYLAWGHNPGRDHAEPPESFACRASGYRRRCRESSYRRLRACLRSRPSTAPPCPRLAPEAPVLPP